MRPAKTTLRTAVISARFFSVFIFRTPYLLNRKDIVLYEYYLIVHTSTSYTYCQYSIQSQFSLIHTGGGRYPVPNCHSRTDRRPQSKSHIRYFPKERILPKAAAEGTFDLKSKCMKFFTSFFE
jgi:hypothetical protein